MNGNVKLSTIASAVHLYPSLGEINKKGCRKVFRRQDIFRKSEMGVEIFSST